MRYKENFGPAKILKSSSFEYSIKQEWLNLAEQKKFFSDQNNQKEIRESIFFKSIEINYDFLYKDGKDIFVLTKNRFCSISEHFKAEKDNWKFSFAKGIFAAWLSVCCGLFGVDFMKKFIWFHDDSSE
ncbi:hypothetical protein MHBO_003723 [Bonamia ostreae]|uniref:Uncharacterized protein n=1 Tax=Bonamia ostreae TaxID=126728 RepID=A0ABV2ARE1_9EUKA